MSQIRDPRTGLVVLEKQPSESRIYTFNFASNLGSNTIASVTSIISVNQNLVSGSSNVTVGTPASNDTTAQALISAGTDREDYKVTAIIVDSASNILEMEGILKVRDF